MATACAEAVARLLEPVTVAGLSLPNRVVMAPMSRYACPDGVPHADVAAYYARRAAAGVGLLIGEGTYVDHPSAASYEAVPHFHGAGLAGWRQVVEAVHAAGGRMVPQLWHTGSFRQSWMGPAPGVPGLGPSENLNAFTGHPEPTRAMTDREVAEVIEAYAAGAEAAQVFGFDGVEVHGAHGYLIDEFLWAATNRRSDRYGGGRRERTRFAVEIVGAMRRRVGPGFPLSFRFSQWKQQDYGSRLAETPAELADILEPLVAAGVSILHCSTRRIGEPGFPAEGDTTLAGWAKRLTGVPVIAVGSVGLRGGAAALDTLAQPLLRGEFDLVAVGRALLADPDWVLKLRAGRLDGATAFDPERLKALW